MDEIVLTTFLLGVTLGLAHAFDPDHLVAVGTMAAESESLRDSSLLGLWWGIGHTLSLGVVGGLVLSFKWVITEQVATEMEVLVAGMIMMLGLSVLWHAFRTYTVHWHPHQHDGHMHMHMHVHDKSEPAHHHHAHESIKKALGVGMVHGLAGSAALSVAVMATMPTFSLGMLYILLFGFGSIAGMALMSAMMSVPFLISGRGLGRWSMNLRILAGCFAVGFGGYLAWSLVG